MLYLRAELRVSFSDVDGVNLLTTSPYCAMLARINGIMAVCSRLCCSCGSGSAVVGNCTYVSVKTYFEGCASVPSGSSGLTTLIYVPQCAGRKFHSYKLASMTRRAYVLRNMPALLFYLLSSTTDCWYILRSRRTNSHERYPLELSDHITSSRTH